MTAAIVGARCALHPDRAAIGTCKRCGSFACDECDQAGFDSSTVCVTCAENTLESRYHVVPLWRFLLLSVLTWGTYEIYWFWKNWSAVKRADGSDIWPIPRAIFAGITFFMLITDLNTQLAARGKTMRVSIGMGIGFIITSALHRAPDPYSMISLVSVVFFIPAVRAMHTLSSAAAIAENARWRVRHTVLLVIFVPFFLLATVALFLPEAG